MRLELPPGTGRNCPLMVTFGPKRKTVLVSGVDGIRVTVKTGEVAGVKGPEDEGKG